MEDADFKAKLEAMSGPEFDVLWDRLVLVLAEAKRRGLLAAKSDDLFQQHIEAARQEAYDQGYDDAVNNSRMGHVLLTRAEEKLRGPG